MNLYENGALLLVKSICHAHRALEASSIVVQYSAVHT
jgi:hypothetical protein